MTMLTLYCTELAALEARATQVALDALEVLAPLAPPAGLARLKLIDLNFSAHCNADSVTHSRRFY